MFTHTTTVSKPFLVAESQTPLPIRLITIKTENKIADQEKSLIDTIALSNDNIAICTSLKVANTSANYIKNRDVDIGIFSGKGRRHLHVKPNTSVTPPNKNNIRPYMKRNEDRFNENDSFYNDVVETVKSAKNAGYTRIVVCFTNENQIPDSVNEFRSVMKYVHDEECISHVFFTEHFIQEVNKKIPFIVSLKDHVFGRQRTAPFVGITTRLEERFDQETFDIVMHEVWTTYDKTVVKFIPNSNKLTCADRICQELFGKKVISSLGSSTVTIGETMEKSDSKILAVYTKSTTISIRVSEGMMEVNLPHTSDTHHIVVWEYGTSTITQQLTVDTTCGKDLDGEDLKAQDVMEMYLLPQSDTVSRISNVSLSPEPPVILSQLDGATDIALKLLCKVNNIYTSMQTSYYKDNAKLNEWLDVLYDIGRVDIVVNRFPIFLDKTNMISKVIKKMLEGIPCQKNTEPKRTRVMRQTSVTVPLSPPQFKRARFDLNDEFDSEF